MTRFETEENIGRGERWEEVRAEVAGIPLLMQVNVRSKGEDNRARKHYGRYVRLNITLETGLHNEARETLPLNAAVKSLCEELSEETGLTVRSGWTNWREVDGLASLIFSVPADKPSQIPSLDECLDWLPEGNPAEWLVPHLQAAYDAQQAKEVAAKEAETARYAAEVVHKQLTEKAKAALDFDARLEALREELTAKRKELVEAELAGMLDDWGVVHLHDQVKEALSKVRGSHVIFCDNR